MYIVKSNVSSVYYKNKFVRFENGQIETDDENLIKLLSKQPEKYNIENKKSFKEVSKKYKDYDIEDMRALCVEKGIEIQNGWNKTKIIKVIEGV